MRSHILALVGLSSLGVAALACGASSSSPTPTSNSGGATAGTGTSSTGVNPSTTSTGDSTSGSGGGSSTTATGSSSSGDGASSTGVGGGSSASTGSGGSGPTGFRAIPVPISDEGDTERITGIFCASAHACVLSGDPFGDAGHIYASDGHTLTALVTGDDAFAAPLGTLGSVSFLGFSQLGTRLVAHIDGAEGGFLSATGDVTKAASWTAVPIAADLGDFGLNAQFDFASSAGHTTMIANGRIWDTTDTPGATASWTNIYSPQATPPIPEDIANQRTADPTLCDTDPSVSIVPDLTQSVYMAADLSLIITPSGAVNQDGDDPAGVCISTDGGHSFHNAPFAGIDVGSGPMGVTCTSNNHCIAYGGNSAVAGSTYIYVSTDATHGATSHWTAATVPNLANDTDLRSVAFAPDGLHGWIVGSTSEPKALLYTTADGGVTWTNATSTIAALATDNKLHSVYAFDATHVWIGGQNILLTSGD